MLLPSIRLLDAQNQVLSEPGATLLLVELCAMLDTVREALQSLGEGGIPPQVMEKCRVSTAVPAARCLKSIVGSCRGGLMVHSHV